jgi:5-methylcytosine-specific restriction endonuclease McrA
MIETKIIQHISLSDYKNLILHYTPRQINRGNINTFRIKRAVYKQHGFQCKHCSATGVDATYINGAWRVNTINSDGNESFLTMDHIIPKSKGGKMNNNIQILCEKCNVKKGNTL